MRIGSQNAPPGAPAGFLAPQGRWGRGLSDVDAHVGAVGAVAGPDMVAHIRHESPNGGLFSRAARGEVRLVSAGNDQRVAVGKTVAKALDASQFAVAGALAHDAIHRR